jgi:hypothetical protein
MNIQVSERVGEVCIFNIIRWILFFERQSLGVETGMKEYNKIRSGVLNIKFNSLKANGKYIYHLV